MTANSVSRTSSLNESVVGRTQSILNNYHNKSILKGFSAGAED
jgi:hypothetical protein